jgi:hypothetical protein
MAVLAELYSSRLSLFQICLTCNPLLLSNDAVAVTALAHAANAFLLCGPTVNRSSYSHIYPAILLYTLTLSAFSSTWIVDDDIALSQRRLRRI